MNLEPTNIVLRKILEVVQGFVKQDRRVPLCQPCAVALIGNPNIYNPHWHGAQSLAVTRRAKSRERCGNFVGECQNKGWNQ